MTLTDRQSNMFNISKAFALISIVLAHMPYGNNDALVKAVQGNLAQVGVFIYFFCSGFFYKRKENDTKSFWLKKLKTVIIPWIIIGSGTFAISFALSGFETNGLFVRYVKWVLGIGSIYWYMLILVICFALFKFIHNNDILLCVCVIVSLVSVYLSAFKIIEFNQYLNVFNWIGVFALGVLIRNRGMIEKLHSSLLGIVSLIFFVVFTVISSMRCIPIKSYIDAYSFPVEVTACIVVFWLSYHLCNNKLLIDIGKKSFFVYLSHVQVAGALNTRLPHNVPLLILRPFIVIVICYVFAKVLETLLKKSHLCNRFGSYLALR